MSRVIFACAATAFLVAAGFILNVASNAFVAAQERSIQYRYISEALAPVSGPEKTVIWSAAVRPLARSFTEADERIVGTAVASAWRVHAAAMSTGETKLLEDYFTGVALARAQKSAAAAFQTGVRMAVLKLKAQPTFYHLDGSVLQFEAEALSVRFAIEENTLAHFELTRDTVVTTLMNETTGWRVFSHELRKAVPVSDPDRALIQPGLLAGVNYYPSTTPWRRFWPEFDEDVIDDDFGLVSELGANAIRIFLPVETFAAVKGDASLKKLESLLRLAEVHGLKVVPTLFDLKPTYSPAAWADDVAYLSRVLPVLSASTAVTFVDLKNEPDLDFSAYGPALVEAWLRTMSRVTQQIAPDLALTIGWSDAEPAAKLNGLVDVVSYHDYAPLESSHERLQTVQRAAAGKPVYVTEIGASSYSLAGSFPGSQRSQASELAARLDSLRNADGVFVWTLHDFEAPDTAAVGNSPWTLNLQSHFGMMDASGARKPAADVVSAAFANLLKTAE